MAGELHHEVAREAVRAFDNDRPRTVAEKPFQHFRKAWTVADRVRAAHCRIVEDLDDLVACGLGVRFDRRALALVAILVGANVRPT
jgi:hypothetical protein